MILTAKVISLSEPPTEGAQPRATLKITEADDFFKTIQIPHDGDFRLGDCVTLTVQNVGAIKRELELANAN